MPDNRAKYIATVLQAVILGAVTYYGVKWLVDAMDPTKKNRLAAQKQVGTLAILRASQTHRKPVIISQVDPKKGAISQYRTTNYPSTTKSNLSEVLLG